MKRRAAELERDDLRFGLLAAVLMNTHSGKNAKRYKPEDFFTSLRKPKKAQTPEEMFAVIQSIHKQGKKITNGKHRQASTRPRR